MIILTATIITPEKLVDHLWNRQCESEDGAWGLQGNAQNPSLTVTCEVVMSLIMAKSSVPVEKAMKIDNLVINKSIPYIIDTLKKRNSTKDIDLCNIVRCIGVLSIAHKEYAISITQLELDTALDTAKKLFLAFYRGGEWNYELNNHNTNVPRAFILLLALEALHDLCSIYNMDPDVIEYREFTREKVRSFIETTSNSTLETSILNLYLKIKQLELLRQFNDQGDFNSDIIDEFFRTYSVTEVQQGWRRHSRGPYEVFYPCFLMLALFKYRGLLSPDSQKNYYKLCCYLLSDVAESRENEPGLILRSGDGATGEGEPDNWLPAHLLRAFTHMNGIMPEINNICIYVCNQDSDVSIRTEEDENESDQNEKENIMIGCSKVHFWCRMSVAFAFFIIGLSMLVSVCIIRFYSQEITPLDRGLLWGACGVSIIMLSVCAVSLQRFRIIVAIAFAYLGVLALFQPQNTNLIKIFLGW